MKHLHIIILSLTAFVALMFFDNKMVFLLNCVLVPIIYFTLFLWEYSVFDKKVESDFKIKAQKKSLKHNDLIFASFYTLIISSGGISLKFKVLFITLIWASFIINIVMYFIYKKRKPYNLFMHKNKLELIERSTMKRDLRTCHQIHFDRFSKKIQLSFKEESDLTIQTKDYKKEDIDELLGIIIEKSVHQIFLPNNYKEEKRK